VDLLASILPTSATFTTKYQAQLNYIFGPISRFSASDQNLLNFLWRLRSERRLESKVKVREELSFRKSLEKKILKKGRLLQRDQKWTEEKIFLLND